MSTSDEETSDQPISTRGVFIVLEGIDHSGKTTQCKLLQEYLSAQDTPSVLIRFPDRTTPIGSVLNAYLAQGAQLDDRAAHLLFSANRWEVRESIWEHLVAGTTVICDRYAYSGVAFSASKGLDVDWCKHPDRGLPQPDAVIYLDLSVEEAMARGDFGNELYEREEAQRAVKFIFETNLFDSAYWYRVSANVASEYLHESIKLIANEVVNQVASVENEDIRLLWSDE